MHSEYQYLDLLQDVLNNGIKKPNRTGIDCLTVFGRHMVFDLSDGNFPLITTKKMFWNGIVDEFLFFVSGETNINKGLLERSRHWWNKWITKDGDIGPIYPKQYRNFQSLSGSFDQLKELIHQLINDPESRRHLITSYNPADVYWARKENPQLLYPCHGLITQFSINDGRLSLCTYQRSMDIFIGGAVNIAHYGLLLCALAKYCNLLVGTLNYFIGDAHIYENHIEQVKIQLSREPKPWPKLEIASGFDLFNMKCEDFKLVNYIHHNTLKAQVAV